ncbi:MAG: DinB family protein [Gemmatimonadota bacterium]
MTRLSALIPPQISAYQRVDIAAGLRQLCSASEIYWNSMSAEEFASTANGGWSPAENVRHCTRVVRAVSTGMSVPRLLLRLRFGRAKQVSRSYEAIVSLYRERLRRGGQAGKYAPSKSDHGDPTEHRREVLSRHREAVEKLARQILDWRRTDVDSIRLPHPLLGKLTVREMLLFVLYHNLHHVYVVARRRGEWFTDETPLSGP